MKSNEYLSNEYYDSLARECKRDEECRREMEKQRIEDLDRLLVEHEEEQRWQKATDVILQKEKERKNLQDELDACDQLAALQVEEEEKLYHFYS